MVTNLRPSLLFGHRGRVTNQTNPVTSGSNRDEGYGSGKKTGIFSATDKGGSTTAPNLYGGRTCH